jgi:hypothetical protein
MLQEFLSSVRGTVIYPIEDSQFKAIVQLVNEKFRQRARELITKNRKNI